MPARSTRCLGVREPQLHHRDEAVAAGQRPCFLAEIGKQLDGVSEAGRAVIDKRCRYHISSRFPSVLELL